MSKSYNIIVFKRKKTNIITDIFLHQKYGVYYRLLSMQYLVAYLFHQPVNIGLDPKHNNITKIVGLMNQKYEYSNNSALEHCEKW